MTKLQEDFDFCMNRATEYLSRGDAQGAFQSFASDVKNYPDVKALIPDEILVIGMFEIMKGPAAIRKWLEGFPRP